MTELKTNSDFNMFMESIFLKMTTNGLDALELMCMICEYAHCNQTMVKSILRYLVSDACDIDLPMNIKGPLKNLIE